MRRALRLARKGDGKTSPNPMVGAVVVKGGRIIGEGYHRKAGGVHAEIEALQKAGNKAKGATLFVNLEPCCHHGKTPPCVDYILRTGIKKVYAGMCDPNPLIAGKGIHLLKENGIDAVTGILGDACRKMNEIFIKFIVHKKPFVILKSAISLDGKIATSLGESRWITSEKSRRRVHLLRNCVDAVLIGAGTVLKDNPSLTTRLNGRKGKNPARIILDNDHQTLLTAKVFQNADIERVIYASSKEPSFTRREKLTSIGVEVWIERSNKNGKFWSSLLNKLAASGVSSVLIEGGGKVNVGALEAKIVDKVLFFIAPILIGGDKAPGAVGGEGAKNLASAPRLNNIATTRLGDDLMLEGYL